MYGHMSDKFVSSSTATETYLDVRGVSRIGRNLEEKIRFALAPDSPSLLKQYLVLGSSLLVKQKRVLLRSQFELLLDTAADECLPIHWRILCFDHIHQPLFSLQRITHSDAEKTELACLFKELRVMGYYLFH